MLLYIQFFLHCLVIVIVYHYYSIGKNRFNVILKTVRFKQSQTLITFRPAGPAALPSGGQHRRGLASGELARPSLGRRLRHHQLPRGEARAPHDQLDSRRHHQVPSQYQNNLVRKS